LVRGARDAFVQQRWAEQATGLRSNRRLVVIERAAHTMHFGQPAWLTEVIWPEPLARAQDIDPEEAQGLRP
jgi:hypothetical protein